MVRKRSRVRFPSTAQRNEKKENPAFGLRIYQNKQNKQFKKQQLKSIETVDLSAQDQSKLLELLGLINFKILSGDSLYLEVDGARYKVLYGVYWRSVFTGEEHYLLRCSEITEGMWIEGCGLPSEVDLAIRYKEGGWIVKDCSLKFIVTRCASFS